MRVLAFTALAAAPAALAYMPQRLPASQQQRGRFSMARRATYFSYLEELEGPETQTKPAAMPKIPAPAKAASYDGVAPTTLLGLSETVAMEDTMASVKIPETAPAPPMPETPISEPAGFVGPTTLLGLSEKVAAERELAVAEASAIEEADPVIAPVRAKRSTQVGPTTLLGLSEKVKAEQAMAEANGLDLLTAAPETKAQIAKAVAAEAAKGSLGKKGWTKAAVWNKNLFRAMALGLSALAVAKTATPLAVGKFAPLLAFSHLTAHSFWFGSMLYTTFIAGMTMYKNLPRKTFGNLQSKLFPQYFRFGVFAVLVELVTARALGMATANITKMLVTGLVAGVLNLWFIEPKSTKIMFERYALEVKGQQETPRYKKLVGAFNRFHGLSSAVNLVALCAAVAYSFTLGSILLPSAFVVNFTPGSMILPTPGGIFLPAPGGMILP